MGAFEVTTPWSPEGLVPDGVSAWADKKSNQYKATPHQKYVQYMFDLNKFVMKEAHEVNGA